jgi:hypothetical protein
MRRPAVLLLALLPVSVASAAGPSPLLLFSGQSLGGPDAVVQHVDRIDHTRHCEKVVRR